MNTVEIIEKWQLLQRLCNSIGWKASIERGRYVITPNFGVMHALQTPNLSEAIGFIRGIMAGKNL